MLCRMSECHRALAETDITNWVLTVNNGVDALFTLEGPLSGNDSTVDGF